jgi:hypothetical protein
MVNVKSIICFTFKTLFKELMLYGKPKSRIMIIKWHAVQYQYVTCKSIFRDDIPVNRSITGIEKVELSQQ